MDDTWKAGHYIFFPVVLLVRAILYAMHHGGGFMAKILVTCARSPAAIHLGRLLHASGHTVILADTKRFHLGRWRSWPSKCMRHPSPRHQAREFSHWLQEVVKTESIDCVIPVYEETFHHALNHGTLECDHFCSDIATLDRLHNKFEFIQLAKSIGINVPETVLVENIAQVKSALTADHVLKPVYSRFGENVIMKPNLSGVSIDVSKEKPWVLQERLEGKQYCLQGICKDGRVLSSVAYSSDFTVSKSSVFFERTGKGDLGGIIEKIASNCNFTGFLSFDVILGKDGTVRPIECNPRATSALHLYSTHDNIDDAVLRGQAIQCTGISRRLVLPMWINLASNLFKKNHFKSWRKARKRSKSVEWNILDPRPGLMQLISLLGFAVVALRNRISLIAATTHEFEWNGR
ncbi:MAG: hypothetical protein CMB34_00155 [Euryarchaeota archaeon]|nr:hypothetical protein [Euryarchaeota archaeon]